MKRKVLTSILLCAALAVAAQAAETETETATEAVTEAATEAATEVASEGETEAEEQTEAAGVLSVKDLPAYVAADYVKLGEYKGIEIEVPAATVSEEELNTIIAQATITSVKEGVVEEGDVANIDYVGKKDDVAFDGGTAAGYDLVIGSHTFIEGFEEGLVGKEIGSTVDLPLKFPEQYHSDELAGQEVIFTVTINYVQRSQELTDEVAAKISEGMTAESYKESVRADILATKEAQIKEMAEQEVLAKVCEAAEITDYPAEHLEFTVSRAMSYYSYVAAYYGMTMEDYLAISGVTEEDFLAMVDQAAKEALGQEMCLQAVFEAEGMELTDAEYADGVAVYAAEQGQTVEDLEEVYGVDYLKSSLIQEKALNFLYGNAKITEKAE